MQNSSDTRQTVKEGSQETQRDAGDAGTTRGLELHSPHSLDAGLVREVQPQENNKKKRMDDMMGSLFHHFSCNDFPAQVFFIPR